MLVIHGGPDWDHTYLREPLAQLGDRHRLIMPDIRGCGRIRRLVIASSSIYPVPPDAYEGWAERDARMAAVSKVWSDRGLSGAELLHGAQDMTAPARLAAQAAATLPNARAVILNAAGHMTHIDQPSRWLDALAAFLGGRLADRPLHERTSARSQPIPAPPRGLAGCLRGAGSPADGDRFGQLGH